MSSCQCVAAYERHKNLKLAADELGMSWQNLYVVLRKEGVRVTGDKSRYGSEKDRLAAKAERMFAELVPMSVDKNKDQWQSKVDFAVGAVTVDVKASRPNIANKHYKSRRWAFCVKKQEMIADFFVCAAFDISGDIVTRWLVIPGELVVNIHTVNLPASGGKWGDYEVPSSQMSEFFEALSK